LLDGKAEAITDKLIEKALAGDTTAMRLCIEPYCRSDGIARSPSTAPESFLRKSLMRPGWLASAPQHNRFRDTNSVRRRTLGIFPSTPQTAQLTVYACESCFDFAKIQV
jgi:hypothetical protein